MQFVVSAAGREVIARRPRHLAPKLTPGQAVWCIWEQPFAHVFSDRQRDLVHYDPAAETPDEEP
jgi:hypothetical protein